MNFNDMKYERPDFDALSKEMSGHIQQLKNAKTPEEFLSEFKKMNICRVHLNTMVTLAQVRHTINTADPFYDNENTYWDETMPKYQALDNQFIAACVQYPDRSALLKEIPETFFQLGECALKSFDEKIIPEMVEENRLTSEYGKLKASAKIEFDGEMLNLAQIAAKTESKDRNTRKRAYDAKIAFYQAHEKEFDSIYDQLVHLRDTMAKKLGYSNYVEMAYYRMNRLDYDGKMIADYRDQIRSYVTPAAGRIYEKQRQRLGYDKLEYYDMVYEFKDGNPTPKGTPEQLIEDASKMYHEMSRETGEFIDVMVNNNLWDLISRPNKEMGGYCTEIQEYKVPFIFSNFNGTSGDVNVLTHEAGHAFQSYMSKGIDIPDISFPTMESCEIDSMSMEFFAYPWLKLFFQQDADKYRYSHLCGTLTFLPYGVLVDHFQQAVYENPDLTPDQRKGIWRTLEKQYMPFKNYDGCEFLEKGCWRFQQGHIFESPFYYIDYTLAQVCAQQFFIRMNKKDPDAWKDYIHLCKLGGTLSFTKLVKEAGLQVPFENGCIPAVVDNLEAYLNNIDDSAL